MSATSRRKILLIADDSPDDILLFREAFSWECSAVEIYSVENGQQAIDYLSGSGRYAERSSFPMPSLLFLDITMPVKSGFEVLDWIRTASEFRQLPVAILSGSLNPSDKERASCLGADYLVKPANFTDLLRVVEKYCGRFAPPG